MSRLRPLTEEECYTRCYGDRDDNVTVVRLEPRKPRIPAAGLSGEHLRRQLETRIDTRDPAELVEPEAA